MKLKIIETQEKDVGYVEIKDMETGKHYYTAGKNALRDIDFINIYGEPTFLEYLPGSTNFQELYKECKPADKEIKICPRCNTENHILRIYCIECGENISKIGVK